MPFSTIGDLRQHLSATQNTSRLKSDLNTLVQEITTGEKSDLTEHLGLGQAELNGVNRQLAMLESYIQGNAQTSNMLSVMQSIFEHVDDERSAATEAFLKIDDASTSSQISNASSLGLAGFEAAVNALNTRYGDSSLFGGGDLQSSPLASSETMISELEALVTGLTSALDVTNVISGWFDDVGGGFETNGYLGDAAGYSTKRIDNNQSVSIDARADDHALRSVLKGLATAHFASSDVVNLSIDDQRDLLQTAATDLFGAGEAMASLQSRIGFVEERVEEASVRNLAEQTSYSIAKSELISADPFETATRLEAVQLQLETQYTLTSRLSGLSLTGYLR